MAYSIALTDCAQSAQYSLTISVTEGGEVVTPSEASSSYDRGAVVPLVALPHTGYRFVGWTGDVNTIDDVNAASTTINIDGNYQITANFETTSVLFTVTSLAFFDYSGNGIQDSGEPSIEGIELRYEPRSYECITDKDGKGVVNLPAGSYRLYVDNPGEFRYSLPSVSEIREIEDGLSENIAGNTTVAVPLAEGFLTLPFSKETKYPIGRYYDHNPSIGTVLDWNGKTYPYSNSPGRGSDDNHTGTDFDVSDVDVLSSAPGVVFAMSNDSDNGKYVEIEHPGDFFTTYQHLSSISVSAGQSVSRGQKIGISGDTGTFYKHLHLEFGLGRNIGPAILDPYSSTFRGYWGFSNGNTFWEDGEPENTLNRLGWWTSEDNPTYP